MQEATQRVAALERDLFCVASTGVFIHTFPVVSSAAIILYFTYFTVHALVSCSPTSTSGQLGNDDLTTSSFASRAWKKLSWFFGDVLLSRSPIAMSPGFTPGDYDTNLVTAGLGMPEIGARQLNDWRSHEPPDVLHFCQPGVPFNTPILLLAATSSTPTTCTSPKVLISDCSVSKCNLFSTFCNSGFVLPMSVVCSWGGQDQYFWCVIYQSECVS